MPTLTKPANHETAVLALDRAIAQQRHLGSQIGTLSREMDELETGGSLWQKRAEMIAGLREELTMIESLLPGLEEAAKSEEQKQQEAEQAQAAKELDKQSGRDLKAVQAIVARVNAASDELSAALFEFYRIERSVIQRLGVTKKLKVKISHHPSPDFLIGQTPMILTHGDMIRPVQRRDFLKTEAPNRLGSKPRKAENLRDRRK